LQLNFILNNQGLPLWIDGLLELGGDGMMGSLVLNDQAFVALHPLEDTWLLNGPIANVGPFFGCILFFFLLSVRWLPPRIPIISELLKE
jgi:hypothetical protein